MQFKNYLPKKEFFTNKWTWITLGGSVFIILGMFSVYLYSPKFLPQSFISTNKKIIEAAVGKELATVIDQKRDADGATSIRTLFNTNKEENLTKHCEKKEEKGQVQEKCFKTYRNEEQGYSFEYPVDWDFYKNSNEESLIAKASEIESLKNDEIKYRDTDVPFMFGRTISIRVFEKPFQFQTLQKYSTEYLLSSLSEGNVEVFKTTSGLNGFYVYDKGPNRFGGGIGEYYIFENNNKFYELSLDHEMLSEDINQELSGIIKSLALSFNLL